MISSFFIDVKIYIHNYFTDYFFGGGAKSHGDFYLNNNRLCDDIPS